jgi:predicted glycosyltransferase
MSRECFCLGAKTMPAQAQALPQRKRYIDEYKIELGEM